MAAANEVTYPCPACRTTANLDTGCGRCGRPPDPEAAEVIALNDIISELTARVEMTRQAHATAVAAYDAARLRRAGLTARIRDRTAQATVPAGPPPAPAGPDPVGPALPALPVVPARPETTTKTVQNVLFVLGGLLLAGAAVAFTGFAWRNFGVGGRAAILAAVTLLTLAVPPTTRRRGLSGTAETFAALGLLLLLLDGYAAWRVNLAGVATELAPETYAGLVFGLTAAVALGYGLTVGLTGPRYAAIALAQPVLPLLAASAGLGLAGWAVVFATVSLANVLVAWRYLAVIGWPLTGLTLGVAGILALAAVVTSTSVGPAVRSGVALMLVAAIAVVGAQLAGLPVLRTIAGAAFVLALVIAVTAVVWSGWPDQTVTLVPATIAVLAVAIRALPGPLRAGPRIGGLIAAGAPAAVAVIWAVAAGTSTALAALPAWRAQLRMTTDGVDWQPLVATVLLTFALAVLLPRAAAAAVTVAGLVLVALAVPESFPLEWWAPALVDAPVAVALAVVAVTSRTNARAALSGGAAGLLAAHAVVVGLARPVSTAGVLAALVGLAAVLAALGQLSTARAERGPVAQDAAAGGPETGDGPGADDGPVEDGPEAVTAGPAAARRPQTDRGARLVARLRPATLVGAVAAAIGLLALPGLTAAVAQVLAAQPALTRGWAAAGLVLAAAAVGALRRWWPEYVRAAAITVPLAGTGVILAVILAPGERFGVYAALSFGCNAAVAAAVLPGLRRYAPHRHPLALIRYVSLAPISLIVALVAVSPALWSVLIAPYSWLTRIWSGAPSGVGLTPEDIETATVDGRYGLGPAAVTLGLLAIGAALCRHAIVSRPAESDRPTAAHPPTAANRPTDTGRPMDTNLPTGSARAWRGSLPAVPPAAVATVVAAAALSWRWPTVAALSLAIGLAAALVAALRWSHPVLGVLSATLWGAGLAGTLATEAATLTALGVGLVATALCGVVGIASPARLAGLTAAVVNAAALAFAAARATDVPVRWAAFWVLAAAVAALGASVLLGQHDGRGTESRVVEVAAHTTAGVALLLTTGSIRHAAGVCTLWGVALGLRALAPRVSVVARRARVVAAAVCGLIAYWLLLVSAEVAMLEAYTLPAAGLGLLAGAVAARVRPGLHSWSAYGPALIAGFGPSLATIIGTAGDPTRRLGLGLAALAVVVGGAVRRRQAPVVIGGVALVLVTLHEAVLVSDEVPRWVPLALGGALLVGLAITYEQRRRDVGRLRTAVAQMR